MVWIRRLLGRRATFSVSKHRTGKTLEGKLDKKKKKKKGAQTGGVGRNWSLGEEM